MKHEFNYRGKKLFPKLFECLYQEKNVYFTDKEICSTCTDANLSFGFEFTLILISTACEFLQMRIFKYIF